MVTFYSSFVTKAHMAHTHTHTRQGLKEAPGRHSNAFVKARFPMSPCSSTQIDHRSTGRCMKGKCMHIFREVQREGERGEKQKSASFLSLHTFPLPHVSIFPSPLMHSSFPLPLSTEESSASTGNEALWRWSRTALCSLPPLFSLPTALPFSPPHLPSTLRAHPSALRGPRFRSAQGNCAPNPSPSLALLPQASQAVPLHRRDREVGGLAGGEQRGVWGANRGKCGVRMCLVTFIIGICGTEWLAMMPPLQFVPNIGLTVLPHLPPPSLSS